MRLPQISLINPRNDLNDDLEVSFIPMTLVPQEYGQEVESEIREWREIKRGYTHFQENDIAFAKITPCFQNRKSTVLRGLVNGAGAGTTELIVFRVDLRFILPDYVLLFFKSPGFIETGISKMKGTAGQQRVPNDYHLNVPFPLPPYEEQKRIVARVDELLGQTAVLAQQLAAIEEQRRGVNTAVLHQLTSAPTQTSEVLKTSEVFRAFDRLYVEPETIDALKQAILQLAVQGRLVPQDTNDEPVTVLLGKIANKRQELVEAKEIRKFKPQKPMFDNFVKYKLPNGWVWCSLSDIILYLQTGPFGSNLHKSDYVENGTPVINPSDMRDGSIVSDNAKMIGEQTLKRLSSYKLKVGDIVLARRGEMGRCAAVTINEDGWLCGTGSLILRLTDDIYQRYLIMLIQSNATREYLQSGSVGATMSNLNQKLLLKMPIALPPLAEQKCIVAKVDELFALCIVTPIVKTKNGGK